MDAGLLLLAALVGDGGGAAVDGGDAGGLSLGLLSADVAVDQGVDDHVAGSKSLLAGGQLLAGDGNQLVGSGDDVDTVVGVIELGLNGAEGQLAAVGNDLGDGVAGLEDVLSDAVIVIVDDDEAVAQAVALDLLTGLLVLEVGGDEVLPADLVGDVVGGGVGSGTHIDLTIQPIADLVGIGKDGLQVVPILLGQLVIKRDGFHVSVGRTILLKTGIPLTTVGANGSVGAVGAADNTDFTAEGGRGGVCLVLIQATAIVTAHGVSLKMCIRGS